MQSTFIKNRRTYELAIILLCIILLFFTLNTNLSRIFTTVVLVLGTVYFFPSKRFLLANSAKAEKQSDLLIAATFIVVNLSLYLSNKYLLLLFGLLNLGFMLYVFMFVYDKKQLAIGEYRVIILFHFLVGIMLSFS